MCNELQRRLKIGPTRAYDELAPQLEAGDDATRQDVFLALQRQTPQESSKRSPAKTGAGRLGHEAPSRLVNPLGQPACLGVEARSGEMAHSLIVLAMVATGVGKSASKADLAKTDGEQEGACEATQSSTGEETKPEKSSATGR